MPRAKSSSKSTAKPKSTCAAMITDYYPKSPKQPEDVRCEDSSNSEDSSRPVMQPKGSGKTTAVKHHTTGNKSQPQSDRKVQQTLTERASKATLEGSRPGRTSSLKAAAEVPQKPAVENESKPITDLSSKLATSTTDSSTSSGSQVIGLVNGNDSLSVPANDLNVVADNKSARDVDEVKAELPWVTVKARKKSSSKKTSTPPPNRLVTEYFPVRRSDRASAKQQKTAAAEELHQKIVSACEDGLTVVPFAGKGRGVVSKKSFKRGDFVVEYAGELIDQQEARRRENAYAQDTVGCYMYYFSHKNKQYCVDATAESGRLGRLLNHSKQGNCTTKLVEVGGVPRLVIIAAQDIDAGEELLYDYGDRSKTSLEMHPWLKA